MFGSEVTSTPAPGAPAKQHVMDAPKLIEPLPLTLIAPTHGPILRVLRENMASRHGRLACQARILGDCNA
jgi:hypothetical protein